MCQINFSIQYTDADGDTLQAAEGRYKLQNVATFSTIFNINLSNPKTPDIKVNGVYDLEVRVQDVRGLWSEWFTSPEGFKVGDCTEKKRPTANAGKDFDYIIPFSELQSGRESILRTSSFTLNGSGVAFGGKNIESYLWEKISGGSSLRGNILSPNSSLSKVEFLSLDTYTFRLTVTDSDGLKATDEVSVNVYKVSNQFDIIENVSPENATQLGNWISIFYIKKSVGSILVNGDVIYTDESMTRVYQPSFDTIHTIRLFRSQHNWSLMGSCRFNSSLEVYDFQPYS